MPRRTQFTVDAESVQSEPGATVTFRCLKVGEANEYRSNEMTAAEFLQQHIVSWAGIVDDDGNEWAYDADALGGLYLHEQEALMRLLWQGPDGASAKN